MDLKSLNPSQKQAAEYNGKHLLVLAGAGSGKTKTIIARAAFLISGGVPAHKIQILTFTRRAASEIVSRVQSELAAGLGKNLSGLTFHSWCNYLLSQYPNLFGVSGYSILDESDQLDSIKYVCGQHGLKYREKDLKIYPQGILDIYSFARNTKRNLTQTIEYKYKAKLKGDSGTTEKIKNELAAIYKRYEEFKQRRNYFDFDDLLQITANRMKNDPDARSRISQQYEHILVDEMQDTNPLQWDLLNPFQDVCNLFCVGDDAQSIYSFRGADFKNVHSFTERVKDSKILKLEDNYRSTQEILDLANWVLDSSPLDYNKHLRAVRGAGEKPVVLNVRDEYQEAEWISNNILDNVSEKNKKFSDHLILTRVAWRTNNLEASFLKHKIPYVKYGGRKFLESAHLRDVLSVLRIVNNFKDEIAWLRYLTIWNNVGNISAAKCIRKLLDAESIARCAACLVDNIDSKDTTTMVDIINYASVNILKPKESLQFICDKMETTLRERYREDFDSKRKADFSVLESLAGNYPDIANFLNECVLENAQTLNGDPLLGTALLTAEKNDNIVVISTIHSAKGLESDICFVLAVEPGNFPSTLNMKNVEKMEEERRVLYVALTRAKNRLIITRNIAAINTGTVVPVSLENKRDVRAAYFFNALPQNLTRNEVINRTAGNVAGDKEAPNNFKYDFGIDLN
jgi:DNA helicase-2/ATP-dependent DNA helicase PcrA